jgi:hypothetical protein
VILRSPILITPGRYENGLPEDKLEDLLAAFPPVSDHCLTVLDHEARLTWIDPGFDLNGTHQRCMAADMCRLIAEIRRLRGAK